MALIDQTYFEKRLIVVPNLNRPEIITRLNNYIELHEPDYLETVLGYQLAKEFSEGLESATPDEKWTKLRDGSEFIDNNRNIQKWIGFNNELNESPIAYYTYFYLVREGNNMLSTTGVIQSKNENSDRITPLIKLTDAYNYMVKYNRSLACFIESNSSTYSSYAPKSKLIESMNYYGL